MRRVAVLGDVHGNAVALRAVLEELSRERVDGVVWTGDLSRGPFGSDDPAAEQMVEMLTSPASPAELIEHAEQLQFSD